MTNRAHRRRVVLSTILGRAARVRARTPRDESEALAIAERVRVKQCMAEPVYETYRGSRAGGAGTVCNIAGKLVSTPNRSRLRMARAVAGEL